MNRLFSVCLFAVLLASTSASSAQLLNNKAPVIVGHYDDARATRAGRPCAVLDCGRGRLRLDDAGQNKSKKECVHRCDLPLIPLQDDSHSGCCCRDSGASS